MAAHESQPPNVELFSPDDTTSTYLTLPNGRRIGYALYGPENGAPFMFFHGAPGSRINGKHFEPLATSHNCRLISIDRPGVGLSSPVAERYLRDYPADVVAVADHLGLSKFRVLGVSAGGPYALSCAAGLPPDRLIATGVVVGLGPPNAGMLGMSYMWYAIWKIAPMIPWLIRWYWGRLYGDGSEEAITQYLEGEMARMTPEQREELMKPEIWNPAVLGLREAMRQGIDGYVQDTLLLSRRWDIDLHDAKGPVRLYYAGKDVLTTPQMGQWMHERLEDSKLKVYEDAGHGDIMSRFGGEVLEGLLAEGQE